MKRAGKNLIKRNKSKVNSGRCSVYKKNNNARAMNNLKNIISNNLSTNNYNLARIHDDIFFI